MKSFLKGVHSFLIGSQSRFLNTPLVFCYHCAGNVNYQLTMDIAVQTSKAIGFSNITVLDYHSKSKIQDVGVTKISSGDFHFSPNSLVFVSFYQDIEVILPLVSPGNGIQIVNIWHGMPLRAINLLSPRERDAPVFKKMQENRSPIHHFVTSSFFKNVFVRSFAAESENVHIIGNLRDLTESKDLKCPQVIEKVILFAPTNNYLLDSCSSVSQRLGFNCDDSHLNDYLRKKNIVFLFKPHPLENCSVDSQFENIKTVDQHFSWESGLELNHIFHKVDLFVSDCSSLVVDFLKLDKPIILVKPSDDYINSVPFNLSPSLLFRESPRTIEEFLSLIDRKIERYSVDKFSAELRDMLGVNQVTNVQARFLEVLRSLATTRS
jgi:CDP-glycerol glycerophosphotransferase (TagB/SpsB family)